MSILSITAWLFRQAFREKTAKTWECRHWEGDFYVCEQRPWIVPNGLAVKRHVAHPIFSSNWQTIYTLICMWKSLLCLMMPPLVPTTLGSRCINRLHCLNWCRGVLASIKFSIERMMFIHISISKGATKGNKWLNIHERCIIPSWPLQKSEMPVPSSISAGDA